MGLVKPRKTVRGIYYIIASCPAHSKRRACSVNAFSLSRLFCILTFSYSRHRPVHSITILSLVDFFPLDLIVKMARHGVLAAVALCAFVATLALLVTETQAVSTSTRVLSKRAAMRNEIRSSKMPTKEEIEKMYPFVTPKFLPKDHDFDGNMKERNKIKGPFMHERMAGNKPQVDKSQVHEEDGEHHDDHHEEHHDDHHEEIIEEEIIEEDGHDAEDAEHDAQESAAADKEEAAHAENEKLEEEAEEEKEAAEEQKEEKEIDAEEKEVEEEIIEEVEEEAVGTDDDKAEVAEEESEPANVRELKHKFVTNVHFASGYKKNKLFDYWRASPLKANKGGFTNEHKNFPDALATVTEKLEQAGSPEIGEAGFKDISLYISGFASSSGNAEKNRVLSKERAQSVGCYIAHYLKMHGVESFTLHIGFFGEGKSSGNGPKAQANDRRVEIFFHENPKVERFEPKFVWRYGPTVRSTDANGSSPALSKVQQLEKKEAQLQKRKQQAKNKKANAAKQHKARAEKDLLKKKKLAEQQAQKQKARQQKHKNQKKGKSNKKKKPFMAGHISYRNGKIHAKGRIGDVKGKGSLDVRHLEDKIHDKLDNIFLELDSKDQFLDDLIPDKLRNKASDFVGDVADVAQDATDAVAPHLGDDAQEFGNKIVDKLDIASDKLAGDHDPSLDEHHEPENNNAEQTVVEQKESDGGLHEFCFAAGSDSRWMYLTKGNAKLFGKFNKKAWLEYPGVVEPELPTDNESQQKKTGAKVPMTPSNKPAPKRPTGANRNKSVQWA
jgi:flagellar biosynthesis GTPase FlhF